MSDVLSRLTTALSRSYRVDRELGQGGMATVYLAHDLKHERDVAIKVLHPDLGAALGAERFLSEIKTTAKLQHPHILPLLDSGAADGLLYYVMPYVRGETLRARLEREQQLPIPDALLIAREVADALHAAHGLGIVHRDIKPENILLQDGHALVADFGIALAVQTAGGARMTQTGLSLGTPSYMSPEQAMGERTIDARSDIYALGAVTYEMLAGEPPFTGASVQAIVAKVLASEPESLRTLRKTVPPHIEAAVLAALSKLPADRPATAKAFASSLDGTSIAGGTPVDSHTAAAPRRFALWLALATALVAAGGGWWIGQRTLGGEISSERVAVDVSLGASKNVNLSLAISPNGEQVAVIMVDSLGTPSIRIRDLSVDSMRIVSGTEGASTVDYTFDGKALLFVSPGGDLRSVPTAGGVSTLITVGVFNVKAVEGADGWVYYTTAAGRVSRVRRAGGTPEVLSTVDTTQHEFSHWEPQLLPDGKTVLFFSYNFPADSSRVELLDLATRKRTRLISHASNPRYVDGGFLTFVRDGTLLAARFDLSTLRMQGSPVPVLTDVAWDETNGTTAYSLSNDATLVYLKQSQIDVPHLVREVGRDGRDGELLTTSGKWAEPRVSPDGRFLAMTRDGSRWQIWLLDRGRHVLSQLTRGAGVSFSPNWTPDSRSIIHVAETPVYDIVRTPLDGSAVDTLLKSRVDKTPTSVAPDGRGFSYTQTRDPLAVFVKLGNDPPREIGARNETRIMSVISPDGRWIIYREQSSGNKPQIFVQSLTSPERQQVSSDGGDQPRWSKQGREIVYRIGDAFMAAPFDPMTGEPARPVELFRRSTAGQIAGSRSAGYDVSSDGLHFFIVEPEQHGRLTTASLVFNWRGDLEKALKR